MLLGQRRACCLDTRDEECLLNFDSQTHLKRSLARPRRRCLGNITVAVRGIPSDLWGGGSHVTGLEPCPVAGFGTSGVESRL